MGIDCVMHEGSEVLFRVALSILQATELELLKAECLPDVYLILRTPCEPSSPSQESEEAVPLKESVCLDDLFERMYATWLDSWSSHELRRLREAHLPAVTAEDAEVAA